MDSNNLPGNEIKNWQGLNSSVTFIEVLFAVVISLGLTQVMTRPWFQSFPEGFGVSVVFEILVILLGYSTLLCSWWGYHRSLRRRELPDGWTGIALFVVDIVILAGYWLMLVKFESFSFVLCILFAVHLLYILWDSLRLLEHRKPDVESPREWRRRAVTLLWSIVLGLIVLLHFTLAYGGSSPTLADWIMLSCAHLVTFLYRIHKEKLGPVPLQWILDKLVLKFGKTEAS